MSPRDEAKEREILVAQQVEEVMRRDFDFDPGPRNGRDARDATGLKVDFTYDDASPPLAVEVTSLQDPKGAEVMAKVRAAERKLTKRAENESWGCYSVGVYEHANATNLTGAVSRIIRDMIANNRDRIDVDWNYSDDYSRARAAGLGEELLRRHQVLRAAGLQLIHKVNVSENRVRLIVVRGGRRDGIHSRAQPCRQQQQGEAR